MANTSPPPSVHNTVTPTTTSSGNSLNSVLSSPLLYDVLLFILFAVVIVAIFVIASYIRDTKRSKRNKVISAISDASQFLSNANYDAMILFLDLTSNMIRLYGAQRVGNVLVYSDNKGEIYFSVINNNTKPLSYVTKKNSVPVYIAIAGGTVKYLATYEDLETGVKFENIDLDDPNLFTYLSQLNAKLTSTYFLAPTKKLVVLADPHVFMQSRALSLWNLIETNILIIKSVNEKLTKIYSIMERMLRARLGTRETLILAVVIVVILLIMGLLHLLP